jgi:aryl-alcohol dehydrogenase-like predicted oxidoreductase
MKYTNLGKSGLLVSKICLGTMNFGSYTTDEDSFKILDEALTLGINFIDTANVYGNEKGVGYTEELLGRWLSQGGNRREKIVLATKVFGKMGDGVNDRRLSAYHIKKACEDSLRRLKTDHIDLYQMHHVDRATPWDEIWQAMQQLISEGKIIYAGSSNFAAWNIVEANYKAKEKGLLGLISEQSIYSLLNRHIELEVVPACRAMGVGIIPWSPIGGGMLGGVLRKQSDSRTRRGELSKKVELLRPKLEAYESLCAGIGESPANVAIAWMLKNPAVTSPIVGPRTMEHLHETVKAVDIILEESVMKKLDEIWPGPGNQAPEAYAW